MLLDICFHMIKESVFYENVIVKRKFLWKDLNSSNVFYTSLT